MKVLYALFEPDTLSESYIRTEMEWMEAQGVKVCVWAKVAHISTYPDTREEKQIGGPVSDALRRFQPDLVHTHWLLTAKRILEDVAASGKPLTIRGHSFEFRPADVELLSRSEAVRRIWLFPHFMAPGMSEKARPLPVCYEPKRYFPGGVRNRRSVFRASAGVKGKGLEEFLDVAGLVPELDFHLAVTRATDSPTYPDRLASFAPPNVQIHVSLQHEEVAERMRSSGVYFRNHDPGSHPYGMPASIAEAMGSGCPVLARRDPAAEAYAGDAALYYDTPEEAAEILRGTLGWSDEEWARRESISLRRAERFRTDAVLPEILAEWKRLLA